MKKQNLPCTPRGSMRKKTNEEEETFKNLNFINKNDNSKLS